MKSVWPEIKPSRSNFLIGASVFFCLWLFLRSYNVYPALFLEDSSLRLTGVDSYYHLRHAEAVYNNYPHVLRHDPMSSYPRIERGLNQGFYDVFVATLSKLTFGLVTCKQIIVGISPVLSGLSFCILGGWLWRAVSPWCGVLFWLSILAYPGMMIHVTALGDGDHHAFEIFLANLLILTLHHALKPKASYIKTAVPAAILFTIFLSWAGAPLHLFFVGLCFFVVGLVQDNDPQHVSKLRGKGILFGLLTATLPLIAGLVSPDSIIWDQAKNIFVLGGLALLLGYPILLAIAPRLSVGPKVALTIAILVAVPLGAQLSPSAAGALSALFSPRSEMIAEHAAVNLSSLFSWYGFQTLALIITPLLLFYSGKLKECAVPVVYGLGLTVFWMYTLDFGYYPPGFIAAFAAYALSRVPWSPATPIVLTVLVTLPFLSPKLPNKPWMSRETLRDAMVHSDGLDQAAKWLRLYRNGEGKGLDYGVLAPWDWGSVLAQVSQTPVAFSQTHSDTLGKILYHPGPEGDYEKLANADNPLKFIVIPTRNLEDKFGTELMVAGGHPSEVFQPGPQIDWKGRALQLIEPNRAYYQAFIVRLFDLLGQNMGHYRLVFESPQQVIRTLRIHDDLNRFEFTAIDVKPSEIKALTGIIAVKNQVHETSRGLLVNPYVSPDVRVFEVVPGALIVGKAKPKSSVGAVLSINAPYNQIPKVLTWQTQADEQGEFALRVPYPTKTPVHQVPGSIVVTSAYRVSVDGKTQDVEVTEAQIQSEEKISL